MKRERFLDGLVLLALAVASWKFTHYLGAVVDLPTDDDVIYLRRAQAWLAGDPLDPAWGPLYSLGYAALYRLGGAISAYYLMSRLLIGALPLLVFGLARSFSAVIPSAAAAFVVLISEANYQTCPRVSHGALIAFLFFYLVARRFQDRLVLLAVSGVGLTVASYVRPEFALANIALAIGFGFLLYREGRVRPPDLKRARRVSVAGAGWALTVLAGYRLWGSPFSQARSWHAFSQHFLEHNPEVIPNGVSPWGHPVTVMHIVFPDMGSFGQMLASHPRFVAKFFFSNLIDLPPVVGRALFAHVPLFLPVHGLYGRNVEAAALFLIFLGLIWHVRGRAPTVGASILRVYRVPELWPLLVLPWPGVIASLYTIPYLRHSTTIAVLFWVWVARLVPGEWTLGWSASRAGWFVPLLIVACTPLLNSGWVSGAVTAPLFTREMVNRISRVALNKPAAPVRVFSTDGHSVATFLGNGFVCAGDPAKPFLRTLAEVDIVVSRFVPHLQGPYRQDNDYQAFVDNSEPFGFTAFRRDGQLPFWVRKTLLAKAP